jgi:putative endopeptidase
VAHEPFTLNAYYDSATNNMALPAANLQTPYFDPKRSVAVNLGGIGTLVGHELTHGFDDQGAKFDDVGNLSDWWTLSDKSKFEAKTRCVANEYSTFEALPQKFVNGRLTLGEDIADLGGVKIAFHAYRALRKDAARTYVADGFTEDQQFFLSFGQARCSKARPIWTERALTIDTHAPAQFRVNGSLRNLREFAEAFHCARDTPMNPATACEVW